MTSETMSLLLSGVTGVVVGGILTLIGTYYTVHRGGQQKIAEARMEWNERHRGLSVDLYRRLHELHDAKEGRAPLQAAIAPIAVEILLMINPTGRGAPALDEGLMEDDLLSRLKAEGVKIDMDLVRHHRAVLKHAWRTAKSEF